MVTTTVSTNDAIDTIFAKVKRKIVTATKRRYVFKNVPMSKASRIDPYKYKQFTTPPQKERLSKQLVHGLKPTLKGTKVEGFSNTSGDQRFNLNTLKWKQNSSHNYVKNEYSLRTNEAKNLPNNISHETKNTTRFSSLKQDSQKSQKHHNMPEHKKHTDIKIHKIFPENSN